MRGRGEDANRARHQLLMKGERVTCGEIDLSAFAQTAFVRLSEGGIAGVELVASSKKREPVLFDVG